MSDAANWLGTQLPAMEAALCALVEQNSFTGNREGGQRVVRLLEDVFAMPGGEGSRVIRRRSRPSRISSCRQRLPDGHFGMHARRTTAQIWHSAKITPAQVVPGGQPPPSFGHSCAQMKSESTDE